MITPWKTEMAAPNKPQLQKPIRRCPSVAPLLPRPAAAAAFRVARLLSALGARPARPEARSGLRSGQAGGHRLSRAGGSVPLRGRACSGGKESVAALGPWRPRRGVGGASRHRPAAPERSAVGGTQTGWCSCARAHGERGHPHAEARDVTQVLRRSRRA